jgi:hypothetical protein
MNHLRDASESSIGNHRTNIRMSKLSRAVQIATSNTNWSEMVKMLFWADTNLGRREEIGRFRSEHNKSAGLENMGASYNTDQLQYILVLMLILTTAEKRTQALYQQSFAQRCDAISKTYDLKDDQYWTNGKVPAEWAQLDAEFEQRSLEILLEALREYHLDEIADLVQTDGPEQLFDIIRNIEGQFLNVLKYPPSETSKAWPAESGSIPETLQSSSQEQVAQESPGMPVKVTD